MKRPVRIVSLFVIVAMLLSTIAGCGSKKETTEGGNTKQDAKQDVKQEPYTLTFLTVGDMAAKPLKEDDRIVAEINKRLGIKLVVKCVPQNAWDKINVAMASGDLPDVVVGQFPSSATAQWIRDGIILPINDYLKNMPTIKKSLDEGLAWTAVDGKYYGFPFITQRDTSNYTLAFRQDWLDKLKLQTPKTLDEFYNVLKAFAENDPDGNGKKDTFGITGFKPYGSWENYDFVFYAYGMKYGDYELDSNGKVIPKFEDPAFKEGMKYLKRLWDEKLIESEFMLNDTQMMEQKLYQSKAGYAPEWLFRNYNRIDASLKKVVPEGKLGYSDPPAGPDGKKGMAIQNKVGMITAITKGSKNPEKAAKFLEFMVSKEGRDLLTLGIEGIHYTMKDGKIVYNEVERAKDQFAANGWSHPLAWGAVAFPLEARYLPETEPQKDKALDTVKVAARNIVPNLIPVVPDAEVQEGSVVKEIYTKYYMDMLMGKIDIDKGISELSQKWRQQGGDKILKEVQEIYNKNKK